VSSPSVINLLIVDRSRSDIDHIAQTLRGDGYQIELIDTDQTETARNAIDYQPLELILLRVGGSLPTIAEMRLMVAEARQDIPIIAVVDDDGFLYFAPIGGWDSQVLVGQRVVLEGRGVLRAQQRVIAPSGATGLVTSGTFSPTLERSIGLARLPADVGDRCQVDVRHKYCPARIVQPPFVRYGQSLID